MAAQHSYAPVADRQLFGHPAVPGSAAFARRFWRFRSARRLRLAIVCAGLACLVVPLAVGLGPGTRSLPAVRRSEGPHRAWGATTLLRLPVSARGAISAALGGDEAAYRVAGLRAWNPAQRLELRFSSRGVAVSSGATRLSLALAGVGRGAALQPAAAAVPLVASNRVNYARRPVREWYVNGPAGLEQGFDLVRRPAGSGPLTLAVAVSGVSSIRLRDGSALLSGPRGMLRYGGLSATDARGRPLRAWLGLSRGRLLIHVEDRGARYPVRIDPFIQQDELLAGSEEIGEGDFGYSVALSADGNTALIGGPGDDGNQGAVWVFTRAGETWSQQGGKLTATEEKGEGGFGSSVALSADGNTALIGGETDDGDLGAAWVFTRSGSDWTQQAKLTDGEESGLGVFGSAVALSADGDAALVGSPGSRGDSGAAWMFTRSASAWTQHGTPLDALGETGEGEVGASVALSSDGETALIGGPGDTRRQGAAWVFTHTASGWAQQGEKLTGADDGPSELGASVALSADGETALLGAPGGAGSASVFARTDGAWRRQGITLSPHRESEEHIGASVALSADGNTALIGGATGSGVWEFKREGESWQEWQEVRGGYPAKIALSANASTVLLGNAARHGSIGTALVLVEVPYALGPEPSAGPTSGGTRVTIHGEGFEGVTAVTFGSAPASFTVESPTEITAITPPAPAGAVDVRVANAAGSSPSNGGMFTYGTLPSAPTHVHASAGEGQAEVSFESTESNYEDMPSVTVTASPGGAQGTASFAREIAVKGLKNGVTYTFTATAADRFGTGPPSAPSNAVTPGQIVLGEAKLLANGLVELPVQLPFGGGVLSASQAAAAKGGAHESSVRRRSKKTSGRKQKSKGGALGALVEVAKETIGTYREAATLTIKPTVAALRELARRGKLAVPVQVSFVPEGGEPTSTAATNIDLVRPGYSFEAGSEGWEEAWGNLTVAGNAAHHHTGTRSLQITMHSEPYSAVNATASTGVAQDRVGLLQPGVPISMWVERPAGTPPVGFRAMVRVGGGWTECRSAEVRPRANRWVRLGITVPGSANCKGTGGKLEVDAVGLEIDDRGNRANGKSVYLDDVSW
jgi:hypothetical protein